MFDATEKPSRSLRTGVAAIATGLVVAGCAAQPVALVDATPAGNASDPELKSPLAPYMLSWRELTVVNHARSLVLSSCLAGAGYGLPVGNLSREMANARKQEATDLSRLYGITDRMTAEADGYWPPQSALAQSVVGIPPETLERCVAAADRAVGRERGSSPYGLARELLIRSRSQLEKQPTARSAISDWSECMAQAGYRVTSPVSDRGDIARELHRRELREAGGLKGPSSREVALAAADIDCKESTHLVERLDRVGQQLDHQALIAHRRALVASRRRLSRVLDRIAGGGHRSPGLNERS